MNKKIALFSTNAGGGHTEAMSSLKRIINTYAPEFKTHPNVLQNEKLRTYHKISYKTKKTTNFLTSLSTQHVFFEKASHLITRNISNAFADDVKEMIAKDISIYISTHFLITDSLIKLQKKHDLSLKVVSYAPDFDDSLIHFPEKNGVTPDGVIGQNPNLLNNIQKFYPFDHSKFEVSGFIANPSFSNAKNISVSEARNSLKACFHNLDIDASLFDEKKHLVTIIGGSFWVEKVPELIQKMIKMNINWDKIQFVVCTGENTLIKEKLDVYKSMRLPIFPLPFIPHKILALAYRSSSAILLTSASPATIFEAMEVGNSPIIVHSINPFPETKNLAWILEKDLAIYEPNQKNLIDLLQRLYTDKRYKYMLRNKFSKKFDYQLTLAQHRSKKTAEFLRKLTDIQPDYIKKEMVAL